MAPVLMRGVDSSAANTTSLRPKSPSFRIALSEESLNLEENYTAKSRSNTLTANFQASSHDDKLLSRDNMLFLTVIA